VTTAPDATYLGGPLDGQPVTTPARSIFRDYTGSPKPANWGDLRIGQLGHFRRGEPGLYSRQGKDYEWRPNSVPRPESGRR
jgi:hypothetical protein